MLAPSSSYYYGYYLIVAATIRCWHLVAATITGAGAGTSHAVLAPTVTTSCATRPGLLASMRTPAGSTPAGAHALLASMRTHIQEAA